MSLLNRSSPALQKAHDGSKSASEMSSAVSPSKGSSSASWMFTRTQLETEKKTLNLCAKIRAISGVVLGVSSGAMLGGQRAGGSVVLRLRRTLPCTVSAEQPRPGPGLGPVPESSLSVQGRALGTVACVAVRRRETETLRAKTPSWHSVSPLLARVRGDGANTVVVGSLVCKRRCKYDGEEGGCGEEKAPQHEWRSEGAHLSNVSSHVGPARAAGTDNKGGRACGAMWQCLAQHIPSAASQGA